MLRLVFSSRRVRVGGPAIFIDRDGVINRRRPGDYVLDWSQFFVLDGIRAVLKRLSGLGLPIIVISNQAAVGKGLLDPAALEKITAKMHDLLLADQVSILAVYYCPHLADDGCTCRKPKPGLLLQAANDFDIDLGRSIFIGDSETDVRAANAAGCKPVLLSQGQGNGAETSIELKRKRVARTPEDLFDVVVKCLQESPQTAFPLERSPSDS